MVLSSRTAFIQPQLCPFKIYIFAFFIINTLRPLTWSHIMFKKWWKCKLHKPLDLIKRISIKFRFFWWYYRPERASFDPSYIRLKLDILTVICCFSTRRANKSETRLIYFIYFPYKKYIIPHKDYILNLRNIKQQNQWQVLRFLALLRIIQSATKILCTDKTIIWCARQGFTFVCPWCKVANKDKMETPI